MAGFFQGEHELARWDGLELAMAAAFVAARLAPNSPNRRSPTATPHHPPVGAQHTNKSGSFTFMVNGVYDPSVLDKLNWFCRDWQLDEPTKMDPHPVRHHLGGLPQIGLDGSRSTSSPATVRPRPTRCCADARDRWPNIRSTWKARAIDAQFMDVGPARIRDIAMRMEAGGVGFYPTGVEPGFISTAGRCATGPASRPGRA